MARPASTSTIGGKATRSGRSGFTLVELMLASVLSLIVFAAIFSAYIFMARNLARIANFQQLHVQDRKAFFVVSKDVNDTVQVNTAQPDLLILTLPPKPPLLGTPIVTYTYNAAAHTLARAEVGPTPSNAVLLSNLITFTFNYYDQAGAGPATLQNTKQVEMSYSSAVGDSANGTRAPNTVVSSRMILRGKPAFGQ